MMKISRFAALGAVAVVGAFGLTGCEFSNTYMATCTTSPPSPHPSPGTVGMSIDAPPEVRAGSTFTLTVESLTVNGNTALFGSFFVGGGASPSGTIDVGSITQATSFPVTYQFTVTGQPGEKITITPSSVSALVSTNPLLGITCEPAGEPLATLPIVAPTP
jgi:hypothetical protein